MSPMQSAFLSQRNQLSDLPKKYIFKKNTIDKCKKKSLNAF